MLMTFTTMNTVFWDVTPCSLVEIYLDIRGTFWLLIQSIAVNFSGMLNSHQTIWHNFQKESISHSLSSITNGTTTTYLFNSARAITACSQKELKLFRFPVPIQQIFHTLTNKKTRCHETWKHTDSLKQFFLLVVEGIKSRHDHQQRGLQQTDVLSL